MQSARLNLLVQAGAKERAECEQNSDGKAGTKGNQKKEDEKNNWLWCTLRKYWKGKPTVDFIVTAADLYSVFEIKGVKIVVPEKTAVKQ